MPRILQVWQSGEEICYRVAAHLKTDIWWHKKEVRRGDHKEIDPPKSVKYYGKEPVLYKSVTSHAEKEKPSHATI